MRLHVLINGLLQVVSVAAAVIGNSAQIAANNTQDLQSELPLCAQQCLGTLNCTLDTPACYCADEALLAVETCAWSNCSIRQSLVVKQTHRTACNIPERSYSWMLLNSIWTLFGLAVLAIVLRFIARSQKFGGVGFGPEDWTVLACLAPLTVYDILLDLGADSGLGKDMWTLQPAQIDSVLRYIWIAMSAYTSVLVGVQVSIVLFYIRIFGGAHRRFRALCAATIALCISSGLAACIGSLFYCSRISLFWTLWDGAHAGTCRTAYAQVYTMAGINIFLDLVIIALPISNLRDLNVPTTRKVGLGATFLVGILSTCVSIVRLRYIIVWGNTSNPTWDYNRVAIASSYGCHLSIICASMPSIGGLWRRFCMGQKASELNKSRSTPPRASTSKDALYEGAESVPQRQRANSSVRVTTTLAEFLAMEERVHSTEVELTQRGIDHANAEIERFKALV